MKLGKRGGFYMGRTLSIIGGIFLILFFVYSIIKLSKKDDIEWNKEIDVQNVNLGIWLLDWNLMFWDVINVDVCIWRLKNNEHRINIWMDWQEGYKIY